MTDEQIRQNAEEYATSQYGEYDEHDYTDHSGRNMCHAVSEKAFIAGAHSRDEEIESLQRRVSMWKHEAEVAAKELSKLRDPWISVEGMAAGEQ